MRWLRTASFGLIGLGLTAVASCVGDDPETTSSDGGAPDATTSDGASSGTHATACAAGLTTCAGSCVDTRSDDAHCGTCSNACTAGKTCYAGVCDGRRVVDFSAGNASSCAVLCARTSDKKIFCWGHTHRGQLGAGLTGDANPCTGGLACRRVPVELPGADAVKVSTGREMTMFQRQDGSLWAVGYNSDGRLGHSPATDTQCGTITDKCALSPVKVVGLP